ncbi:hypothetical protein FM037_17295 [Shewanella psychropiezotolerans]|uniref:Uncharacterized protein n=1 Tax=Shewanella psychropiezotolerans TaxID=2593655 RepID=A0ABX5WZW8_9GAMM|nr:hypothetical protein [Shewanella psychropiezotolerans]QDO84649.1 hypothetical protein FM037_17295 [Shewanella psychropiezotolerans]
MVALYVVCTVTCFLATTACLYFYLPKLGVNQALGQRSSILSTLMVGVSVVAAIGAQYLNELAIIIAVCITFFIIKYYLDITKAKVFTLIFGLYIVNVMVVSVTLMIFLPSYQPT